MENINSLTLGQIVASNYKAAAIFEKHQLDFCCQGNRNFVTACETAGLKAETIEKEINNLTIDETRIDFTKWPLDLLSEYIYEHHHKYIEEVTPTIKNLLDKICAVHGNTHPELLEIRDIFNISSGELAMHMKKEELILFPFIKKLEQAKASGESANSKLFNSVISPIQKMEEDHLDEGEQLLRMTQLSNNFTPPEDACLTYITTYKMLQEYEKDMHLHIHLENNILFPKAITLEQRINQHS